MATQDTSIGQFLGQSWASWADKMSITDGNDEEEEDKSKEDDESDSMKLNRKDMDLFGFCPSRDEFTLVMCEVCNLLVKPQALKHHMEIRHGPVALHSMVKSEDVATSAVLTSELAKTLSLPVSSFSKALGSSKPPTKASLKHGPGYSRMSGSAQSAGSGTGSSKVNMSSRFRKSNTNPVVKVERMPREVESIKRSASNSPAGSPKAEGALGASRTSLTSPTTLTVTTLTTQPVALTTPTTSVTYTRPFPSTVPTATSTTSVSAFSKTAKPARTVPLGSALAATLTAAPAPVTMSTVSSSNSSSKSKKSPKERKFLPCKDREFDPNKHCGVVTEDAGKGRPCTRSLTCKTHALGLRRAVQGRKKPFDELLREHKAAKEALLKAKAEGQTVTTTSVTIETNASVSFTTTAAAAGVTSPAALAAASAVKLGQSGLFGHRDVKPAIAGLLSPGGFLSRPKFPVGVSRFTPGGVLPPTLTIKEEPSPVPELSTRLSQSSDQEGDVTQDKSDVTYLSHHPRPAAVCTYGARMAGGTCALFSRRMDLVRAAFLSALERQLNPPPHKKLCVESNLPKEPQAQSNSKDPYEFTTVDSGLAGHPRQSVSFTLGTPSGLNTSVLGKPVLKHKAKSLSSHSLGIVPATVTAVSSAAATSLGIPTLGAALLRPAKSRDNLMVSRTPTLSGTLSLQQAVAGQSVKRKRSGSNQGGVSPAHSVTTGTLQLQGLSGVGVTVTSGAGVGLTGTDLGRQTQQHSSGLLTSVSSVNSHAATTPITAITIPSVNLANAATLGLNATLPSTKQGQGQKGNIIKDFNLVFTGIDPSLMNGQYVNISGAQLAELAAAQAVSATAEDKNIKRSRLAASAKHGGHKVSGTLETLRALQGNSVLAVPPTTVLVDGSLQGTVLAPVSSLGAGGASGGSTSSTFVALTSTAMTTSPSSSSITVTPTLFRAVSDSAAAQQVTLSTTSFANGIIPSSSDKLHVGSVSSHHQQHHRGNNNNSAQSRIGSGQHKTLASGLLQAPGTPFSTGQGLPTAQLAHLKPATFNITKSVGGKLTMQPVSFTIPLMGQALAPSQQQNPHPQPTLLVTTNTEDVSGGGGGVGGGNKTELHLQPQISSASSGIIS
ncbi:hypothetical protein BaRGS_00005274 [Batillaria attramentaria]|uniref:SCA7 domain-containing protein n=1 Tax=Batillaria attramentaria TaxID=370345 RepID=A0ABD0LVX5_9CAEN